MNLVRIFEDKNQLWCPCYSEDEDVDIFTILLKKWDDTEYLTNFFKQNLMQLRDPYWCGISIDQAITLVREENYFLQEKLICIAYENEPGCIGVTIESIFRPFKKHSYVVNNQFEDKAVKGKIDSIPKFLRLYGIQLADKTIVVSGGAIKLISGMHTKELQLERDRIRDLYNFLEKKNINGWKDLNSLS